MKQVELEFEDLPVCPGDRVHFHKCTCEEAELGRTQIDGEWFPVCAGCGSMTVFKIKPMHH